jgi:hypothetical protein
MDPPAVTGDGGRARRAGDDASTGIYAAIVTYTMNAEPGIGAQTVEPAANNGGTSSADPGN